MSRSGTRVLVFATAFASVVACTKKDDAGAPSPVPPLAQGAERARRRTDPAAATAAAAAAAPGRS